MKNDNTLETIAFIGGDANPKSSLPSGDTNVSNRRSSRMKIRLSPKTDGKRRSSIEKARSILKSLSPKKDRDDDVFFSPYQGNDNDPSSETKTTEGRKSVVIGSTETITDGRPLLRFSAGSSSLDVTGSNDGNTRVPSMVLKSAVRPTISSLESSSDATKDPEGSAPLRPKRTVDASRDRRSEWHNLASDSMREKRKLDHSPDIEAPPSRLRSRTSIAENQTRAIRSSEGSKRRRLSRRARTRLTMREVNSHVQPGRHFSSLESMCHFEKRKTVTIPKIIDFFLRIEGKLIAVNVAISAIITLIVVHTFPEKWQDSLKATSLAVSILGAFLSFALVFRTQTCYNRWWEARTQWGRMTSACVGIAGQARNWFVDEDLVDKFLTHCIVFPYACKSVLRGNLLNDPTEEGQLDYIIGRKYSTSALTSLSCL